ncbi:MAG: hypothetical protein GF383_15080 [Candidatus Lokiarchaeota archaeon]|nr:hypothetical protein [Candidatus Lokiarchaeota archaeon]MBD3342839.1 hypothetical protein [Candidatus Lokiarchaeota archaeon]
MSIEESNQNEGENESEENKAVQKFVRFRGKYITIEKMNKKLSEKRTISIQVIIECLIILFALLLGLIIFVVT